MNSDDFKRLYPTEPVKPAETGHGQNTKPVQGGKPHRTSLTNIGQILLICFLFVMILLQSAKIMSDSQDFAGGGHLQGIDSRSANVNADPQKPAADSGGKANANSAGNPADRSRGDSKNQENRDNRENYENHENHENYEDIETILILGEHNGKLAVLSPDGQTVYETFDVYINTLPDYDRNLLQTGIEIKTAEQLYSLLEDYNS